jgi:hypothetical protein
MWHFKRPIRIITQLIISTFCLSSWAQTKTSTKNQEQYTIINKVDTTVIAILPFDKTQYWVFKDDIPTDLTNYDLLKIETILNQCVNNYNPEQERYFKEINNKQPEYKLDWNNFTVDKTPYKRQYTATMNPKDEKEVWINCFCNIHNLK